MLEKIKKIIASAVALALAAGAVFADTGYVSQAGAVKADESKTVSVSAGEGVYPWTPAASTGDYIADAYEGIESGHVFESVTQERLLDILSSDGTYYIVFGGPEHATSQAALPAINEQAKEDGVSKIYHFDPYIDGYQIDITDANTGFKGNRVSVSELWDRIVSLLPQSEAVSGYQSSDTLLFAFHKDNSLKEITAYYSLKDAEGFDSASAKSEIAGVFRKGDKDGEVTAGDVRDDYSFFKRIYDSAATYIETRFGDEPSEDRVGSSVEIFTADEADGFPLHQVNFNELINLLNSDGEHIIFFGASWCHNTQAIIGEVAKKAKASGKKVYVYDTTVGNQLTFADGSGDTVTGTSSSFNSRNNASTPDGNNNISYVYGELVKYFGDFITENNSKKNALISYYPNGDLSGQLTSVNPWDEAGEGEVKSAIRLQMPFLLSYDKNADKPVTHQWLHKNAANDGTYTEYMLELAWVLATPQAVGGGGDHDGLSNVEFAAEAVKALDDVFGKSAEEETATDKVSEETTAADENGTAAPSETTAPALSGRPGAAGTATNNSSGNVTADKTKAPGRAVIKKIAPKKKNAKKVKITLKKIKASGYQIAVYRTKKNAKKNKKAVLKKTVKKPKAVLKSEKLKNQKQLYLRVRAYNIVAGKKKYGVWSAVKKVKIRK